jgi:hypothetical protein
MKIQIEYEEAHGRMSRTEVWISREEMVDRWLYEASLEASEAIRSKISETKEFRIAIALLLNGGQRWAMEDKDINSRDTGVWVDLLEDLVDV